MSRIQKINISTLAKEFNETTSTIQDFLTKKGHKVKTIMAELTEEQYMDCVNQFQKDKEKLEQRRQAWKEYQESKGVAPVAEKPVKQEEKSVEPEPIKKEEAKPIVAAVIEKKEEVKSEPVQKVEEVAPKEEVADQPKDYAKGLVKKPKVLGKIELTTKGKKTKEKEVEPEPPKVEVVEEPIAPASEKQVEEVVETQVVVSETAEELPSNSQAEIEDKSLYKTHGSLSKQKIEIKTVGKIDLGKVNQTERDNKKKKRKRKTSDQIAPQEKTALIGGQVKQGDKQRTPTKEQQPTDKKRAEVASSDTIHDSDKKKKDNRLRTTLDDDQSKNLGKKRRIKKGKVVELSEEEVRESIRTTLASLDDTGGSVRQSVKKRKKREREEAEIARLEEIERQSGIIRVTDYASPNELAGLMNVPVNQILSKCLAMGLFVSINQRLEKDHIELLVAEFGFQVEFINEFAEDQISEEQDSEEDLKPRAPVVTIMGHVDHGKTSLLDYIRNATVVAGEAGGITQHIGAYGVTLSDGRQIAFLDTPGHEAFTAMRARGAKVTDIVIIVIAADDAVMPQTIEAINHAQAAGVPMVFAITKIDKPSANPDKIYQQLSERNILVEEWGGKYQVAKVSSKSGIGIEDLLEKVLLEAEVLDLKANPNKRASAAIIEAELDKGKGIVATVLVQTGTLHVGDIFLSGATWGKVKALQDERGKKVKSAGPSTPVQVLGFNEVPQAGDSLSVMENEREAKEIAQKRQIIKREQQQRRAQKHMSLDMISQRLSEGSIQDLNIIVKGDVDGSVEALADSLMKLSNNEVRVRVIHKAVGPITESDVLLASASDAIIIGFQVRPNLNAKKLAATESIDIRLYSIIYDAINEVKQALEGMLSPDISESVLGTVEIRLTYKISKVGTVAGCYVLDGKINRNNKIRLIRDGVVIFTGELESLKRFKDDVKEVEKGYECGLNIHNYNDIKVGDVIESFIVVETKRKLA